MSSFFVSHFENHLESFGIQSDGVLFWSWLSCVCLGLSKRVESHQVTITVYETDKRKRYKEIFKRSLVSLLISLFSPYEKTRGRVCKRVCARMRVCLHAQGCVCVCVWKLLQYCGLYSTTMWAFNLYICYLIMVCLYCMYMFEAFLWHFPLIFSVLGVFEAGWPSVRAAEEGRGDVCIWVVACEGALSVTSSKDPSSSEPVIPWNNLALM